MNFLVHEIHLTRVPIFGEITIHLKKESNEIFKKFQVELERLKRINQLGILHPFLNIPPYRKYDYIMTMLYLIEKAAENKPIFKKEMKIKGNIKFSSGEELLKSWCLLYSIGHLEMTFASEHAFLRTIQNDKDYFIKIIAKELDLDLDYVVTNKRDKRTHDKVLYKKLNSIIENEKFMEFYKIFTLLKINNHEIRSNYYSRIKELSKIMILKYDYFTPLLEPYTIDRYNKIENIIKYFDTIRKLTFTILDGSFAQNQLNINSFGVFQDLDSFMDDANYKNLLNDVNKFYTSEIFNSPESAYYHHRCVSNIQKTFEGERIEDLTKKIIDNDQGMNDEIASTVTKIKKDLDEKIKPINNDESLDSVYIKSELKDHLRINIPSHSLKFPVKEELNINNSSIFGGFLFNPVNRTYEIDFYPNSCLSEQGTTPHNLLITIAPFYDILTQDNLLIPLMSNLIRLYEKAKDVTYPDLNGEIASLEKFSEYIELYDKLTNSESRIFQNFAIFRDLACYLLKNTIDYGMAYSTWNIGDLGDIHFPIIFKKIEIETIIEILEKAKPPKPSERDKNIQILKNELKIIEDDKIFYVFAPNTYLKKKNEVETDLDILLIKFIPQKKQRILKIGEVKPNTKSFKEDQCVKQIQKSFGIPKDEALTLYNGNPIEKHSESAKISMKSEKDDNLCISEKNESMIIKSAHQLL